MSSGSSVDCRTVHLPCTAEDIGRAKSDDEWFAEVFAAMLVRVNRLVMQEYLRRIGELGTNP
jgi:hypothetical protein